ncbi:MAG TPA: hypothetical protein VG015_02245 [Candidatus Dormibacteraeota bacterium]|jgi:hypothetical protein|nr:hypothetical protein [Candidatus Dormibacteraeota bacterium]
MSETKNFIDRIDRAMSGLDSVPPTGPGVYGAPDPKTGESWNRANVLGHIAEMLEFWSGQVAGVVAGATETGRGAAGYQARLEAINSGMAIAEAELRRRINISIENLTDLLTRLEPKMLDLPVRHRSPAGEKVLCLSEFIDQVLVGHLEGHVEQLEQI